LRIKLLAVASCTGQHPPVSHSCIFFPRFCFDLVFDVNMEVVDNLVIFLMVLVWLENDSWILSYEENALMMS
jgi:hypothetical protein